MRVLLDCPAMVIRCDDDAQVVTMVRSRLELPREHGALRQLYAEFIGALEGLDRPRYALIVDGRAAVGRNDEVFESVQAEFAQQLFGGYRVVLALVATTVGRMQIARYSASRNGGAPELFSDIDEAFAHVANYD